MVGTQASRRLKFVAMSLATGLGMTACSRDYTAAYLYVTSSTKSATGVVTAFAIDSQSGAPRTISATSISSGGGNPTALAASPNSKYIYVANHDTSTVATFTVQGDGTLSAATTAPVTRSGFPTALAVDPAGTYLYVVFTFTNGLTTANPVPGGLEVFPINSGGGALGSPVMNTTVGTTAANPLAYFPLGNNPAGLVVNPKGGSLYVIDQEKTAGGTPFGVLLPFAIAPASGQLTASAGSLLGGFPAGTTPSGIAEDPSGHFLYITDQATNQLYGYTFPANAVTPVAMPSSPFSTGQFPLGVTIDPRGLFVYVANFGSSTIGAYAINQGSGSLSGAASSGGMTATGPTCVAIEPALGIYLYTSNNTDNSISGLKLDPHTGSLSPLQGTQYTAPALPNCALAIPNGDHATQIVE